MINDKYDNLSDAITLNLEGKISKKEIGFAKFIEKNEVKIASLNELIVNSKNYIEKLSNYIKENKDLIIEIEKSKNINIETVEQEKVELITKVEKLSNKLDKTNGKLIKWEHNLKDLKENFELEKEEKESIINIEIAELKTKLTNGLNKYENLRISKSETALNK